jgi:hypothetical protein
MKSTAVASIPASPYLSRAHLHILGHLAQHGETPAWVFDEAPLDEVFKMRPRLIQLTPGLHAEPILDITRAGEAAFRMGRHRL